MQEKGEAIREGWEWARKGRGMTGRQEPEVPIWNKPTNQEWSLRTECETVAEKWQSLKLFLKYQKLRQLDTDGLVKGERARERREMQSLHGNTRIQLCLHCNPLTIVKEPFTSKLGVEGLLS